MRTRAEPALLSRQSSSPWAVILAGGDGVRLRSLTALVTGDARPKQFCPLVDGETLAALEDYHGAVAMWRLATGHGPGPMSRSIIDHGRNR